MMKRSNLPQSKKISSKSRTYKIYGIAYNISISIYMITCTVIQSLLLVNNSRRLLLILMTMLNGIYTFYECALITGEGLSKLDYNYYDADC